MKKLLSLFVILIAVSAAFGQSKYETAKKVTNTDVRLKPINAYVDSIDKQVELEKNPQIVIMDVADYNLDKAKYVKFSSHAAYEKDERDSYETAFIWKKDEKVVRVNMTYSSPSGDWAQYVFYTFYPDGSVAKIDRELRTFMGDIIVNRVVYYDTKGKLVKKSKSFRDLETKKAVKEPESFQDMDVVLFKNVKSMPFSSMLK